jgi:phospholipid/cholesterol/gamma-HCH transport system ATP-binding protein
MDNASDDPRHISDQSVKHNASARDAQVELSPEERRENVSSAAPDGGDIQDVPDERGAEGERDEARHEARSESDGSSRVSVVDEAPPRPAPPDGVDDDEYKWHTYKVYPSGRPDAVEFIDTYKSFGRSHILRGLNMGLPEGMVSMILGPS